MGRFSSLVRGVLVAGMLLGSSDAWAQEKPAAEKAPEPPPLPPASARLWLIAPTAQGPWTMRLENEGSVALRVAADSRLLRFEVQTSDEAKPVSCVLPSSLRSTRFPEDRALLLAPGHSYVESFDPRLFCFGKSAVELGPNVTVRAKLGWEPPKEKKTKIKPKNPKPPTGPIVVESTEKVPTIGPLYEVTAPSILLGAATASPPNTAKEAQAEAKPEGQTDSPNGSADKTALPPTPPVDERAGKLELSSTPFVEASAPRNITLTVTAKNVGLRPIVVALRPWMMSFRIDGPAGLAEMCYADNARRILPNDAYRPVAPGATTSFSVLIAEVCPKNIFTKPGLYRVTALMAAKETTNQGVDVTTTQLTAPAPSFVRLTSAVEPFYSEPPRATPPVIVQEEKEEGSAKQTP